MISRTALILVLAVACERVSTLELELDVDEATRSVVIVSDDGEEQRAFGEDVASGGAVRFELLERYVGAYPLELTAFTYGHPLDAFGFLPGAIELAQDGIPLPAPRERRRAVLRGESVDPWRAIASGEVGERIEALRLATTLRDAQCLDEGRCFDLDSGSAEACVPCPEPREPQAPVPPSASDLSQCDGGWMVRDERGTPVCAPWADAAPSCVAPEIALPGNAACVRVGPACPAGAFAEDLPANARRVGSSGDYATIAEAMIGAGEGTIVVLAKGTFEEIAVVPDGVALRGACVESVLRGAVLGDRASLLDVTIEATGVAVEVAPLAPASIGGAVIRSLDTALLVEAGASLEVTGALLEAQSLVAGRLSIAGSAVAGRIEAAGVLELRDAYVTANLKALESAELDVRRTMIDARAIRLEGGDARFEQILVENSTSAPGITVRLGSTATIARAWMRGNVEANLLVRGIGTRAVVEDSVLTDARGDGVRILAEAHARISRTIIERTAGAGVLIEEARSAADLSDVLIRDVTLSPQGLSANGVHLESNTEVTLARARFERIAGKAIDVDGATAELADITIDDMGSGDCHQCSGVCAFASAQVEGERILVRNTRGRAIGCRGTGCGIDVREVRIEDAIQSGECRFENPNSTPRLGQGVVSAESSSVEISRFVISGCTGAGVALEEFDPESFGTTLFVSDGAITGNASGAHLQVPEYPLARVANRVIYRDNRVNVVR
jgi:hypothetical protein